MNTVLRSARLSALGLLTVLSIVAHFKLQRQVEVFSLSEIQPRQPLALLTEGAGPAATSYVARLSRMPPVEAVVRDIQRTGFSLSVTVASIDATVHEPRLAVLGRAELSIVLRGDYSSLKSILSQVLARYPNAVLQRLSFRRLSNATELEANVGLILVTRPATAADGS